jgi:hypothetical protein
MIRFLADIVRVMNMPCREHTVLLSRQLDEPLRPGQEWGLRFHLVLCTGCRLFKRQLLQIRALARSLAEEALKGETLPDPVRRRIVARLKPDSGKT